MTDPSASDRRAAWLALGSALLVAAFGVLPAMLAGTMAVPIQRDLGVSTAVFGAAVSAFYLTVSASAVTAGRLVERWGWRRSVRTTAALSAAGLAGIALLARSVVVFVACLAVGALGQALAGPASNTAVLREMPSHRQGLLFGIKQVSIPVATMIAGLSVPLFATIGWRWAFLVFALVPLAVAMWPRGRSGPGGDPVGSGRRGATVGARRPVAAPLRMPRLVLLTLAVGLASVANISLSTFLVASSVDAGLTEATAGWIVVAGSLVGLVVRVVAGWGVDRRPRQLFAVVGIMNLGGVIGMALLATGRQEVILLGAVLGFGSGWGWSGVFHYGVVRHHPHAPAGATGVVMVGLAGGAAMGPLLSGAIIDSWSYAAAWWTAAGLLAVSSALFLRSAAVFGVPAAPSATPLIP